MIVLWLAAGITAQQAEAPQPPIEVPAGGGGGGANAHDPDRWWKSPQVKRRKANTTPEKAPNEAPSLVSATTTPAQEALEAAMRARVANDAAAFTEAELTRQRLDEEAALILLLAA